MSADQDIQAHPLANIFPLLDGDEFAALAEDISEHGLREPVVLYEGKILDGRNRYRACRAAGIDCRFETFDGDDALAFVISLNLKRRHLSESQRAHVAAKVATFRQGARSDIQPRANLHEVSPAEAAKLLNVSERSVKTARSVIEHGTPELQHEVEAGRVSVSAAADVATLPEPEQIEVVAKGEKEILQKAKEIRAEKARTRREELDAIAAKPIPVPDGQYSCIVIDPPWPMEKIERDVRPNQVAFEYPTMSEDALAAFDVAGMAADDCHLFCWTTHKFLPMALRLLDAWGFRYVCTFVWRKPGGFQPIGLPQYNCEFALYARRGSPKFIDTKSFFCAFEGERREHSRKPDEFYDTVRRVTVGPRIDVFSRESREGFEEWGNEASKFSETV